MRVDWCDSLFRASIVVSLYHNLILYKDVTAVSQGPCVPPKGLRLDTLFDCILFKKATNLTLVSCNPAVSYGSVMLCFR